MKRVIVIFGSLLLLQSCSNNGGESGAVNDGIKAVDSNGGLADTAYKNNPSATDTSKWQDREGTSKRDTFKHK